LTSTVFHVSARAIATQTLSIFGDHSDAKSCCSTGWAMLCSNNVQEVMDFALLSQTVTLRSRIPFLHFFDGFRTSHEVHKDEELTYDDMRAMIDDKLVNAHRLRGLFPDHPVTRGTAQNPGVYFQGRETVNRFYPACITIVQEEMDKFAEITGHKYKLVEYVGASDAEWVVVVMGFEADTIQDTVDIRWSSWVRNWGWEPASTSSYIPPSSRSPTLSRWSWLSARSRGQQELRRVGDKDVAMNNAVVGETLRNIHEVTVPATAASLIQMPPVVSKAAPQFVQDITARTIASFGDELPVSAMSIQGTFPTATSQYEKRNIAMYIPVWDEQLCILAPSYVRMPPSA
jgi:hypothetical protein